ncbi:SPOR domain-containing protein [Nitrosomonas sp. JL21]|uniref:SPOR domain-containing protein n=1 Tax=Nitrosomonas sp. JL21 TaxID=153949 RepID=UPI00136FB532|nr:SPOR domain-containing protein [Nitrosomonas sp. JL21]MBL8497938.1 SPOR domain-containing protein [Nitrosomonas sp.]MCC7091567.1 SPOR domain-containing protein [Nitrosomonas sp.]MXS78280.1 SPOR domain-containing protein [Nitrosomonas sp. JL21]
MTKNISEEELLLRKRARRRLVGAIVLVIFSIIVLPLIFDDPKIGHEPHEIAINLPPSGKDNDASPAATVEDQTGSDLSGRTAPFTDQDDPSKTDQQDGDEIAEWLNGRKRIPIPGVKPKIEPKQITETKAPVAQSTTASAAHIPSVAGETSKGFVIQLGAFSDQSKARQQVENLITNGFKAYTETLKTGGTEVTRVRIGSFANRAEAENELKKLKKLGFDGVVASK